MELKEIFELKENKKYGWRKFLFEEYILPLKTKGHTYTHIADILTRQGFTISTKAVYNMSNIFSNNLKFKEKIETKAIEEIVQKQEIKKIDSNEKNDFIEYLSKGGSVKKAFGME